MRIKRVLSLTLVFLLLLTSVAMATPNKPILHVKKPVGNRPVLGEKLVDVQKERNLVDDEEVRIIVELFEKPIIEYATEQGVKFEKLDVNTVKRLTDELLIAQENVKYEIASKKLNVTYLNEFTNVVNGFSAKTTLREAKEIEKLPNVKNVYIANEYQRPEPQMNNSLDLINAKQTWSELGYKGEGMVVAILDTGIDYRHKDMVLADPSKAMLSEEDVNTIISENDLPGKWFTDKVPYGYNYMDNNNEILDLGPDASMHGMHVAGTVGANGDTENGGIKGVAPEAQLLAMKVFGNNPDFGSTFGDILIRAIDDSIALGADVINMSLGSTASFVRPNDPEQMAVKRAVDNGVFCAVSAGNSDRFGSGWDDPYSGNPDIGVVGSPGLTAETLQVASANNKLFLYENRVSVEGIDDIIGYGKDNWEARGLSGELELIAIGGTKLGVPSDYEGIDVTGKVVLVSRGEYSFYAKTEWAAEQGAAGIIVYDHGLSTFYKNQGGWSIPFMKISKDNGQLLEDLLSNGPITINVSLKLEYLDPTSGSLSRFTSWGTTPNLDFKPEITAPGGNIWSTANDNGYQYMSGTSMASPHVAGGAALVLQRVEEMFPNLTGKAKVDMAKNILMNTANPITDFGLYNDYFGVYNFASPRRQGAGMMDLYKATTTNTVVTEKNSGLSKVALKEIGDNISFTLTVNNLSDETVLYDVYGTVTTDLAINGYNYTESQGVYIDGTISGDAPWTGQFPISFTDMNGNVISTIEAPANGAIDFNVNIDLSNAVDWFYNAPISQVFENGTFIEGFITLQSQNEINPTINIPYIGFYGKWDQAPILDDSNYDPNGNPFYGYTLMMDEETYFLGLTENGFDGEKVAFSPNGDNMRDAVQPLVSFLRNAKEIDINILNENMEKIRDLYNGEEYRKDYFDSGYGSLYKYTEEWIWDGTANNKIVSDGQYYYEIKAKIDYPGAEWQSFIFPVKVDTIAPIIDREASNYDVNNNILTVVATDDDSSIMRYDLVEDIGEELDIYIGSSTDGQFDLSELAPGKHNLYVATFDYAENIAIYDITVTIPGTSENDNTIPYVIVDSPSSFEIYNTNEIVLTGGVIDESGLQELLINGEEVGFNYDDSTGRYEFSKSLILENGLNRVDIEATDVYGNTINFEHILYIDSESPVIAVDEFEPVVEHTVESINLRSVITDNFPSLKVILNGNMIENIDVNFWEYEENLKPVSYLLESEIPLEYGENIIRIVAIDAAGNITTFEKEIYRLQEGEEKSFNIVEHTLFTNGPVSSTRPLNIYASADNEVDWTVNIINPNGEVEATLTQHGQEFNGSWAPESTKKLNGEYIVEINASMFEQTVTVSDAFEVYNYPIEINDVNVIKQNGYVAVEASITNLGPNAENPMLVVQVKDSHGRVVNISSAQMEGLLQGQTIKLSSGFGLNTPGEYSVDVFVWSGWQNTKALSSPEALTFTIE